MADPAPPLRSPRPDRLLACAFAASDLLLEVTPDATIIWAAGAFTPRFGKSSEAFLGRPLPDLIAPADRLALVGALTTAKLRGRMAPVILHLSDGPSTACALAILALPDAQGNLCVTIGPLAVPARTVPRDVEPAPLFRSAAEAKMRVSPTGTLGLVDVKNWSATARGLSPQERDTLHAEIGEMLGVLGGPDALVGELAAGRYGVITNEPIDPAGMAKHVEAILRARPNGGNASVDTVAVPMAGEALTPMQAVRALRFALTNFAEGGAESVVRSGVARGLAGFIEQAQLRALEIRRAIVERRFRMAFQPIVTLAFRKVHHYEALLRPITAPGASPLTPQEFVGFCEALGLAEALDMAVLDEVLAALARSPDCLIALNVSGHSMQQPRFRDHLLARLRTPNVRRLLVELTETAEIDDMAAASTTMDRLRDAGVALCLDDFGAGAAAFRYLRDLRVDYVKIDGAYVQGAAQHVRERGFVVSMIGLAQSVGAAVIAEMIATEEQFRLMQELGVTLGQGWLFGGAGPLPVR